MPKYLGHFSAISLVELLGGTGFILEGVWLPPEGRISTIWLQIFQICVIPHTTPHPLGRNPVEKAQNALKFQSPITFPILRIRGREYAETIDLVEIY